LNFREDVYHFTMVARSVSIEFFLPLMNSDVRSELKPKASFKNRDTIERSKFSLATVRNNSKY
jgi:hypothetical protein